MSARRTGSEATVIFSLGSNLGIREEHILAALSTLSRLPGFELDAASSLYETSPVGIPTERNFINAACVGRTTETPLGLLHLCKDIERRRGRDLARPSADRTLDIDIILFGESVIETDELTIPHPRFRQRLFVLVPLAEISPDLRVPPSGSAVLELLGGVAPGAWVRKVSARGDTLNFLKTKKLE